MEGAALSFSGWFPLAPVIDQILNPENPKGASTTTIFASTIKVYVLIKSSYLFLILSALGCIVDDLGSFLAPSAVHEADSILLSLQYV